MVKGMVKRMVNLTSYKHLSRVLIFAGSLLSATSLAAENGKPAPVSKIIFIS